MTAARPDLTLVSAPLQAGALPGGLCPSLSTLTLGTHLRAAGAGVRVFDPSVEMMSPADLDTTAERLLEDHPRLLGLTALSPIEARYGAALARVVKQRAPEVPVVMGGIWATARPEALLARCPSIDGVVVGPGERSVRALAEHGLRLPDAVPGLVRRDRAGYAHTAPDRETPAPAPLDLSLLAAPDRYDIFCWLTSRGCPFDCDFCTERLGSPTFRDDPLEKVLSDTRLIAERQGRWYLWLCDPLFGAHRGRLTEVCDALRGAGAKFLAESRVDVLSPDDVPAMAAAGCNLIYFGLESATGSSLRTLGKLDGRPSRLTRYRDGARALVAACLDAGILPVLGVLNPVPGDTPADLDETLAFCRELAALGHGRADGLGPFFHAFPLRLDPGAPYERRLSDLAALGAEWSTPADPLFGDRFLTRASPTVGPDEGEAFRQTIRALNPTALGVTQRLLRSFPRPYVDIGEVLA
jgi:hypothetical protein